MLYTNKENCDTFAKLLNLVSNSGINIPDFLGFVFTDDWCTNVISNNYAFEWYSEYYLYEKILIRYKEVKNTDFPKSSSKEDPFVLWFTGYLYKFWINYKKLSPSRLYIVIKILPFVTLKDRFGFYHTQDWSYVVEDAIKQYKRSR